MVLELARNEAALELAREFPNYDMDLDLMKQRFEQLPEEAQAKILRDLELNRLAGVVGEFHAEETLVAIGQETGIEVEIQNVPNGYYTSNYYFQRDLDGRTLIFPRSHSMTPETERHIKIKEGYDGETIWVEKGQKMGELDLAFRVENIIFAGIVRLDASSLGKGGLGKRSLGRLVGNGSLDQYLFPLQEATHLEVGAAAFAYARRIDPASPGISEFLNRKGVFFPWYCEPDEYRQDIHNLAQKLQ